MSQTNYNLYPGGAFLGMVSTLREDNSTLSVLAGEDLKAGDIVYVSDSTKEKAVVKKIDATNKIVYGIVTYAPREKASQSASLYKEDTLCSVLVRGEIWVNNSVGTIAANSIVRVAAAGGKLKTTAAATGDVTHAGLRANSGAAVGVLFRLEVNLPGTTTLQA